MSTDGWLPPGVTDADIDRATWDEDERRFLCDRNIAWGQRHCSDAGLAQCPECALKESKG